MNFKKIIPLSLLTLCISLAMPSFAANETPVNATEKTTAVPVEKLMARIAEIRAMDKSTLTSSERKELRKEVKNMKAEVRANNKGVYLSVGAAIIIVLLLIILL